MTTTAHEDQFTAGTQTIQPVLQPYSTEAIPRRKIADMEVALKQQTDRAIQSERDFESLISDDNTIQEYAYELGGTDSGEYRLTAQDVARIAAKASEPFTSAMRSLASYVGAGGYNADVVDADVFEAKIRWGIDEIMARTEKAEAELAKLAQQEPVAWMRPGDEGYDSHFRDHSTVVSCPTNPWTGYIPLYAATVPAPAVPAEWREVMAELAADLQSTCDAEHPHRDQYPSVMRKYNNDMEIVEKARALLQSAEAAK